MLGVGEKPTRAVLDFAIRDQILSDLGPPTKSPTDMNDPHNGPHDADNEGTPAGSHR